ncbi:leucine-rich repeat domain-containing protein [Anabaena minutissima FACHB-250]|nr:leucine-rich repeat domain-containing protein [Anabaena minutissima FACHB-250]
MKNKLFLGSIFAFTIGFNAIPVIAAPSNPENPKTFTEWCKQKSTLPQQTRHTVEVLLKAIGTQDCVRANKSLIFATALDLTNSQISDIQPLSSLTHLTALKLSNNQISDIQVLSNFTELISLDLSKNQISNIQSLSGLNKLLFLNLSNNQISDTKFLPKLTNLSVINISNNPINYSEDDILRQLEEIRKRRKRLDIDELLRNFSPQFL